MVCANYFNHSHVCDAPNVHVHIKVISGHGKTMAKVAFYLGDDKTAAEMRAKARGLLLPYKNLKRINPPAPEYAFALAKIAESTGAPVRVGLPERVQPLDVTEWMTYGYNSCAD